MRFVAAFVVFAFHIVYELPFKDADFAAHYSRVFGQGGWTGVAFFFVLSGFVLAWSAREDDTATAFWRRRLAKVFPNHLLTYAAAAALLALSGLAVGGWRAVPGLFLIQSWFPQADIETSANPVAWSLSCELFFYLAFPWLLRLVKKIPAKWLWAATVAVAALVWCVPLIGRLLLHDRPPAPWAPSVSTYEFWFVYVFPPTRMLEFVLGILMARIVLAGKWIRIPLPLALALVVLAYAVAPEAPYIYQVVAVTVVPLALLVPAVAAADIDGKWSPTRGKVFVWLGTVSFAFYLWHRLVLIYGHRALGVGRTWDSPAALGLGVLALGVVLLLSWLTHAFVEQPADRRWQSARPAAPNAVVAPAAEQPSVSAS